MSTKIYEAYRTTKSPFEMIGGIQAQGRAEATKTLRRMLIEVLSGAAHATSVLNAHRSHLFDQWWGEAYPNEERNVTNAIERLREWECPQELAKITGGALPWALPNRPEWVEGTLFHRMNAVEMFIRDCYKEQLGSSLRDPWALDASVTFREHEGAYYLIPYSDRLSVTYGCLSFLTGHPDLEDFSYWNNTDPPEHVPEEEWDHRASVWEALFDRWSHYLTLDIISLETFNDICPSFHMFSNWSVRSVEFEEEIEAFRAKHEAQILLATEIEEKYRDV